MAILFWLLPLGERIALADVTPAPYSSAAGMVLIEANSGQVILSQEADTALPPASTTKIVTALLALDMTEDLTRLYQVSEEAAAIGESSAYLQAGEWLSLEELLRGMLVHSGNDASYAVAEAVAGGESWFVHLMEMKAMVCGCYSADFANTSGLPAEEHELSALDLARMTALALDNSFFAETVDSKYASIGKDDSYRYYKNTNKLLWRDENISGVKTGTTNQAGPCLVSSYQQGAACYVCVVFNSQDRFGESLSLLTWAAENYRAVEIARSGDLLAYLPEQKIMLQAAHDLTVLTTTEQMYNLTVRWYLPDSQGRYRLEILDEDDKVVGNLSLTEAE